ncbi:MULTISPECIES: acyl-CoA synthetase [unclassified Caulobacter]|uniref:acyl-CoA synthetase n=1 Tax=unclassified Caulobacter TaxID=2648921 RepID=UPI000784F542|nr:MULTISPECIES: acyl-CoA synthetase [unclassified Caulobacter]AZS20037.1 acyl-CoA synthetase [Caulobacter sp. FWC26]
MNWNYGDIFDAVARAAPPERPALIWRDAVVTWGEFDRRTNNLAKALIDLGLKPDARIGILCRNHPAYLEFLVAGVKARLLTVNLNYRYTADEIAYVLNDCNAEVLFYQSDFDGMLASLQERLPGVQAWVRIENERSPEAPPEGALSYETLARTGDGKPLDITRSADDGYLLYTGGTTGKPKGVHWSTDQSRRVQLESPLIARVPQTMEEHLETVRATDSRIIPACPLMHGSGSNSAMGDLLNGGTAIILSGDRFDAAQLWREVEKHRATRVSIVGDVFAKPMLKALDDAPGAYDLSSMRAISSAGLTWSKEVKEGLLRHMPNIALVDILGASEASGLGYSVAKAGKIPETGVFDAAPLTVLIDPDTGAIMPKDRPSEGFIARSGAMANGYFGDPEKTAATYRVIDGVRYAVPGDFARWMPPNQFTLIGRGNLSINTGGEKVFPEEVEEALKLQPGVADVLVVGQPDDKWGKIVVAILKADGVFDEARVRAGLAQTLSAYKHPKRFVLVDTVPRHESGKADYRTAIALATETA